MAGQAAAADAQFAAAGSSPGAAGSTPGAPRLSLQPALPGSVSEPLPRVETRRMPDNERGNAISPHEPSTYEPGVSSPASSSAIRRSLARARDGKTLDPAEAAVLLQARGDDLTALLGYAARVRDSGLAAAGRPGVITY